MLQKQSLREPLHPSPGSQKQSPNRALTLGSPASPSVCSILCNCVLTLRENTYELARLEVFTKAYQVSFQFLFLMRLPAQPFSNCRLLKTKIKCDPSLPNSLEWYLPFLCCVLKRKVESASLSRGMRAEMLFATALALPCAEGPHVCECPQSSMRELVESGRYETREDFSVVLQPFFLNIQLPILEVCSLPPPLTKEGELSW